MTITFNYDYIKLKNFLYVNIASYGHLSLPVNNLLQPIQRLSRHLNNKAFNTIHASVRTAINIHISFEQETGIPYQMQ